MCRIFVFEAHVVRKVIMLEGGGGRGGGRGRSGKGGEGGFLKYLIVSCVCPSLRPPQLSRQLPQLSGRTAASMNVYYRKSAALVFILSQKTLKQLASSVVTLVTKFTFPVQAKT